MYLIEGEALRERLYANAHRFRSEMTKAASRSPAPTIDDPMIPLVLGYASVARQMAVKMLAWGIYVIGHSPLTPTWMARMRDQFSAAAHVVLVVAGGMVRALERTCSGISSACCRSR